MLLYLGPDTAVPLASAVATVVGVALMFWRRTVAGFKSVARFVAGALTRRTGRR